MVRTLPVGFALCLVAGCSLLGNSGSSKPPRDEVEARKWWEQTVDAVPIDTLQCWHHASEFHRQRGSSATYVQTTWPGMTMAGMYRFDQYYPTPIPSEWLPRIQARLANDKADEADRGDWAAVTKCRNCTEQEARDAWRKQ